MDGGKPGEQQEEGEMDANGSAADTEQPDRPAHGSLS
jgi:hypothetical protein